MISVRKVLHVTPAQDIDKPTFLTMHKIAHYTALMDRDAEGRVIWDDAIEFPYLSSAAESDWLKHQRGRTLHWEMPDPEGHDGQ